MICKCNSSFKNTGTQCSSLFDVISKVILVSYYDSTDKITEIDFDSEATSGVLSESYITEKINSSNEKDKWFPLPEMENVESPKNDPTTESFNSGKTVTVREGNRTLTGLMVKQSNKLLKALKSFECVTTGAYLVDLSGNLIGISTEEGKLKPILIEDGSMASNLEFSTDSTVQKISLSFGFANSEKDENLSMIDAEGFESQLLNVRGLLDVKLSGSAASSTELNIASRLEFGSLNSPLRLKGILQTEFVVYNETQGSTVTVSNVSESAEGGEYDLSITGATAGDEITVKIDKAGYESNTLKITV